ncbi:hypothetical protein HNS03_18540 [Amorphus sp. 3PC139-8]
MRHKRGFKQNEITVEFNDAAEFVEGAGQAGSDDDRAPTWKQRADEKARHHRPGQRRGKRRDYSQT